MKEFSVKIIPNSHTKEWLLYKHYAHRIPSITKSFGLFKNDNLVGVCTFGMPPSSTLAESIAGKDFKKIVLELNRLVVDEGLGKNVLSYFVMGAIRQLARPKIIVSFSDANMGHHGYIYQSCNFMYTGVSSNITKFVDENGDEFHFRNIGHYQKNNKINVSLVKKRIDEEKINKQDVANYLRANSKLKPRELDKIFGYKDTCSHWFRLDKGFSFPSVDDWGKLRNLIKEPTYLDKQMLDYKLVADSKEIVKKLNLKKVNILPKHRYILINASKKDKKIILKNIKLKFQPYPKGVNRRYDASYVIKQQVSMF